MQPFIGPILDRLLRMGITHEDIVNINSLVSKYSDYVSLSNDYMFNADLKAGYAQNIHKPNCLEVLTGELEKYGNINAAVMAKSNQAERLSKEIDGLNRQKLRLTSYLNAIRSAANYM